MPALAACVLITSLIVICVLISPQDSLPTGRLALVGFSTVYLYNIGTNYNAAEAGDTAFLQSWSLGVEEQFYFIFPDILWILFRFHGNRAR
jgi:peptidoglycan/LPS O-acetylase OafA/YrhL